MLCAGLAPAASGDTGTTISLGKPELVARVLINVPAAVACQPFDARYVPFTGEVNVSVVQAVGNSIAQGTRFLGAFLAPPFAGDGSPPFRRR